MMNFLGIDKGGKQMNETKELIQALVYKTNLDTLANIIIENATLNYKGNDLRISNEEIVLQFIKYLYPTIYKNKLEELSKQKGNKVDE